MKHSMKYHSEHLSEHQYITLKNSDMTALINPLNGQLVSFFLERELIHPGGRFEDDPKRNIEGWANSGIIMFPIVGASKDNNISYLEKRYPLDQHGMIRSLSPSIKFSKKIKSTCTVNYTYVQNTVVRNIKYVNDIKHPEFMKLPLGFGVSEKYVINAKEKQLEITTSIKNTSGNSFCYALGRHPAFISNVPNSDACAFYDIAGKEVITLTKLIILSKTSAHVMHGANSVIFYDNIAKKGVKLWTDLGNIMLWSPKENIFCIEPITERKENDLELDISPNGSYKNVLHPNETKTYHTHVMAVKNIR